MKRFTLWTVVILLVGTAGFFVVMYNLGEHEGPGTPTPGSRPESLDQARVGAQENAHQKLILDTEPSDSPSRPDKQILFGDFHAHTTFSFDAFLSSLPMRGGEGAHPPADACDFARFVSRLDFWSINDHAEGLTPRHWRETKRALRACSEAAGPPGDKDLVSFLGWEWSQVGLTPDDHYGHKNVILKHLQPDSVPEMPVASRSPNSRYLQLPLQFRHRVMSILLGFDNWSRFQDLVVYNQELQDVPDCPAEGPCYRVASTPAKLFDELDRDGHETLVIPHGTTWGFYTPPGSDWKKQLTPKQHDPQRQKLVELYSGHGNAEEYRAFRSAKFDDSGDSVCPRPTENFTPCCWRAGEIIRERCEDPDSDSCRERIEEARQHYLDGGSAGHNTIPATEPEDWGDCGVCRDCYNPAFKYRPKGSVQYMLALSRSGEAGTDPMRFDFGFIGSSDNHSARPGSGYKEFARQAMTEAAGARSPRARGARPDYGTPDTPAAWSVPPGELERGFVLRMWETERQTSFFMTGGLAAVHAPERNRKAIWSALQRREVYGTSGDRILLWFDLLNGPGAPEHPMGSRVSMQRSPRFRVRAAGAFEQKPGCPDFVRKVLGKKRLQRLSRGECYHPGEKRHAIEAIEIVRIERQASLDQPVDDLIDDPWKRFECPADGTGCAVTVTDTGFDPGADRETLYYARALQEPTPAVNAGGVRCEKRDEDGFCVEPDFCYGDYRTPADDDCLAPNRERAWSSPIFVRPNDKGTDPSGS